MTKRFVLSDTSPLPYFTINVGDEAITVRTSPMESGMTMLEILRGGQMLCRVFAATITIEPETQGR